MATNPNAGAAVLVIVCLFASSFLLALIVWKMARFVVRMRAFPDADPRGPVPPPRVDADMIWLCEYCGQALESDGKRCTICGALSLPRSHGTVMGIPPSSSLRIGGTGRTNDLHYRRGQ